MLNNLKLLLGIAPADTTLDETLLLLVDTATARLKNLLGGIEPPESMAHIILEAAVARFNRIGSERLSSHTVEGESLSFSENDFAGYLDEVQAWLDAQKGGARGRLRFL